MSGSMTKLHLSDEKLADNAIHCVGVSGGVIAVVAVLAAAVFWLPVGSTVTLAIYGAGLLAMLGCSAAYHMSNSIRWRPLLRRLDHAAIFVKIAGTYTPFMAIKIGGLGGFTLLSLVWVVALIGAGAKLLLTSTWDRVAVPMYLVLGWVGAVMFWPLGASVGTIALTLLALGGVLYSVGVIFFLWRALPYGRATWHGFVLVATGCHFGAVTCALFA
jgi:hemolysin III